MEGKHSGGAVEDRAQRGYRRSTNMREEKSTPLRVEGFAKLLPTLKVSLCMLMKREAR